MHSQWAALAMSAVAILAKPLAPPTTGWLVNDAFGSWIFPFTVTQCKPFYIFYNLTDSTSFDFYDATISHLLFRIYFPSGIGYVDWICNIPAGIGFYAGQNFIVQAGSSSACLGDLTTTYSLLHYSTTDFASYTRDPSSLISPPTNAFPTTTFPTSGYPTITLNPILAVIPTTFPPSPVTSSTSSPPSPTMSSRSPTMSAPSSPSPVTPSISSPPSPVTPSISSPPSPTMSSRSPPSSIMSSPSSSSPLSPPITPPSPKSHSTSIAGGVVGAVAFVLLILALMLWGRRRRSGLASSPTNAQSATMGELGSAYPSPPSQSSGAELLGPTSDPCSDGNELKSDSGAMVAPVAGNLEPVVVPVAQPLVALSPANIKSTTGMPPATLSTQQSYDHSAIIARDIGSHISHITINSLHIHHAHPDPSSSLPHLPEILSTTAAQASE